MTGNDIAAALGVAVSIDNDSNLAALGEHAWGAGRGCDDCVTLKFNYGIGCGLFVNGALVRGRRRRRGDRPHHRRRARAAVPLRQARAAWRPTRPSPPSWTRCGRSTGR